jgi:hypothetical protein
MGRAGPKFKQYGLGPGRADRAARMYTYTRVAAMNICVCLYIYMYPFTVACMEKFDLKDLFFS